MSAWVVPGFTEERELGRGASGRVVAAVHDASGREVAIKYLAPQLFRDPAFLDGFREEAAVLRSLDSPEVVRLYDYAEEPGQGAAIIMELVNGVSLHEMISRQGATTAESALMVLKGSLLGLGSAHQLGIVHRDYKPENVLVDGAGTSKLTDFGVAVKAGKKAPTAGTPLYMAPEQWNGLPTTPATDIYAATAVFFECLTGKTPFSGRMGQLAAQHETAAVPVAMIDQPLQELVERGMAKDPRDRPRNAMEFVAELNWVAENAYGPEWDEHGQRELARRAAALLLLLMGGVGGGAGGSFAATTLGRVSRRKKAVAAGTAVGILAAITATTTTLALSGNNSNNAGSGSHPTSSASPQAGSSASVAASVTPTATASASATPSTTATPTPTASTPTPTPTQTTPPPTVISVSALSASPKSPADAGSCTGPSAPTFAVTGTITANQTTTVTYHWSSGGGNTITVGPGGTTVSDKVPSGSPPWNGSDTLTVTSPANKSSSINLSTTCKFPVLSAVNSGSVSTNDGTAVSVGIRVTGGNGSYNYSLSGPGWLSLASSGASATVSGTTPNTNQNCVNTPYTVTVTVTDSEASPQTASTTFTITSSSLCIQ
jgi:serine/threonine-protein kinase